jgi:hypothetical protein
MATSATVAKLTALIGANDMDVSEVKLVIRNWDDAPRKLHTNVINSVKGLEKIPPALQLALIEVSEKAVRAIGELLCEEAQDLVISDYTDDLPLVVRKAFEFKTISENLWTELAAMAKDGELTRAAIRKLIARKDCPPKFAKAAGYTQETFAKAQVKHKVLTTPPAAGPKHPPKSTVKTVKKTLKAKPVFEEEDEEDDFTDPKGIASSARTVRRPR